MAKVAWIGLGVMGYPMAGHVRKKGGHDLTVYNRNGAKAAAWAKEHGGNTAPTPADAANVARELYAAAKAKGFDFLDAPVSGGQAGAQNGVLTVMVGGDQAAFDRALPVISSYARMVTLIGASGAGQLTKMVNQICIAGLVQGLSEAIHFGQKAGLDLQ